MKTRIRTIIPAFLRFWPKVKIAGPDECWLWQSSVTAGGYGWFGRGKDGPTRAHRVAWELVNGPIPAGLYVCHRCDVRQCCNPRHLWLGTHLDNQADKRAKGRQRNAHGERVTNHKLTTAQVVDLRARHAAGESCRKIAKRFGVSAVLVSLIARRKAWAHVPEAS